jgi:hypothetical protein
VKSEQYPTDHDPKRPERPFLPADLFDPDGPWVRFHEATAKPMAKQHFDGAGARAVHDIFLRLPGGRAATEQYLKDLSPGEPHLEHSGRDSVKQYQLGAVSVLRTRRQDAGERQQRQDGAAVAGGVSAAAAQELVTVTAMGSSSRCGPARLVDG